MPNFHYLTDKRIDAVIIQHEEILSLIRNINPNKASGSDDISGHMLRLCDGSVMLPLRITFENILKSSIYPDL